MMFTLEKDGFGSVFDKIENKDKIKIEITYSHPTASIITNQNISRPFTIHHGIRQGCPLSPFLFSVIIEPLAASIRQSPLISL